MLRQGVVWALIVLIVIWLYKTFIPPPPKICGTPGGPPITGPRILLRDGRHLAYEEYGVPKNIANFRILFIHGHHNNKKDPFLIAPDLFEEFRIYIVGFDRPGYGESDPDPKRTVKSMTYDIEELADKLELGPKFYVMGYSAGGELGWGCLKYIPHRLAGVTLMAPGVSYWWPSFPPNLVKEAMEIESAWRICNFLIAHYAPWFLYWWNTQQIFPQSTSIYNEFDLNDSLQDYSTQQGLYESYLRDAMVLFGQWEFEPFSLENPFSEGKGYVHIWQGEKDETVFVPMQRYIVANLSWIHYHEVQNVGHMFALDEDIKYQIIQSLVTNENKFLLSTNVTYTSLL